MVNLQNDSDMEGLHIIADIVMRVSVCDITLFWYYLHNSYFNKRRFFTSGSSCFPIGNILKNDTSIFGIINQLRYIFSVFLNHVFYLFYIWYWWGFGWILIGHRYHIFSTMLLKAYDPSENFDTSLKKLAIGSSRCWFYTIMRHNSFKLV